MATNKVQTGLRLEEGAYDKIKTLAKAQHRSFNNLIEFIVLQYIEDYEEKNGPIEPLYEE